MKADLRRLKRGSRRMCLVWTLRSLVLFYNLFQATCCVSVKGHNSLSNVRECQEMRASLRKTKTKQATAIFKSMAKLKNTFPRYHFFSLSQTLQGGWKYSLNCKRSNIFSPAAQRQSKCLKVLHKPPKLCPL